MDPVDSTTIEATFFVIAATLGHLQLYHSSLDTKKVEKVTTLTDIFDCIRHTCLREIVRE